MFLAFAGLGKKAIHVVTLRGKERVFDAPYPCNTKSVLWFGFTSIIVSLI